MRMVLTVLAVVLAIPPLVVIGIALGPMPLFVAWAILVVAPILLIGWASVRISQTRWRHTGG